MVDIQLPTDLPTVESNVANIPLIKKSEECNDAAQQEISVQYFRDKRIAIFLDCVLTGLYLKQPSDPIDWCMQFLIMHDTFDSLVDIQRERSSQVFKKEVKAYSAKWKLPFLVDELLTDMLKERPEEPDRFALSWFRWNKVSFFSRHFPDGKPKP
eukprot:TRINITY_DN13720_c0_g1_i1.p1 TRINITY_DN13720_c0_g1~~TRINITY_DN13720_c0_g1_i1.p1  ORF type:complete len:155 (+),score=29.98 TRINITY_DN13720_c0_g1_i1:54-518(+)